VGDEGVRSPFCFFNIDGESVVLLGIGDRIIGGAAFSCGIFSCEDDGLEKTIADEYEAGDSTGVFACSEIPLGCGRKWPCCPARDGSGV